MRNSLLRPRGGALPIFAVAALGFLGVAIAHQGTRARFVSAATPELRVPDVEVHDEGGGRTTLAEAIDPSRGAAVLLAPAYARCRSSCPDLVHALERSLRGIPRSARPRVVFFLFDSSESADDVRAFRARHRVPADWSLVRAVDARATSAFFDAYSIGAMTSDEGFSHPSEILVLDDRLRWAGSLPNTALDAGAVRDAIERTRFSRWRATWSRPGTWLGAASIGLFVSLAVIAVALLRMWRGGRANPHPRGTHP